MPPSGATLFPQFYCWVGEKAEGPFDLVELAAQLRYGNIDSQTLICRVGEETWTPLQDLPEYVRVQEFSIEAIALHLEKKERPPPQERAESARVTTLVVSIAAGVCVLFFALALYSSESQMVARSAVVVPDGPAQPSWPRTSGDGFSVECPVVLKQITSDDSGKVESYGGHDAGTAFGVNIGPASDVFSDVEYDRALDALRDQMISGLGGRVSSERAITVGLYHGREVMFTHTQAGKTFAGGLCVLGGRGKLAVAYISSRSPFFGTKDIRRYLESFEVH